MGKKRLLNEVYELKNKYFSTKSGKGFTIVYLDTDTSTDPIVKDENAKNLFKKYKMRWLPSVLKSKSIPYTWGWVIWDNADGQTQHETYNLINKFAREIGEIETAPENNIKRERDKVIKALDKILDKLSKKEYNDVDFLVVSPSALKDELLKFREDLVTGMGSKETMETLGKLMRFKLEMERHKGHKLSYFNTITIYKQNPRATDVRSKTEWNKMGYEIKPTAKPIVLFRPKSFTRKSSFERKNITDWYLKHKNVSDIKELNPSEQAELERMWNTPDISQGFTDYVAYDVSDVTPLDGAEELPTLDIDWYDKDSDETEKERRLMQSIIDYGLSIGIKEYKFITEEELNGARGWASNTGRIALAAVKKNKGLLSTAIHETAHQIMHWSVVKKATPALAGLYLGRTSVERGGLPEEEIKKMKEQEAELCAWLVLQAFGYDKQQQHFNYMADWGMTKENCHIIFDRIQKTAETIYAGMVENLQRIQAELSKKKKELSNGTSV